MRLEPSVFDYQWGISRIRLSLSHQSSFLEQLSFFFPEFQKKLQKEVETVKERVRENGEEECSSSTRGPLFIEAARPVEEVSRKEEVSSSIS